MSKDRKKLLHIHSSVNDKQPTPATLELGELGVNNAKGNAFISTKNSDGEVVRFSEDETIIGWMEQKEVFPYEGYMRGADNSQVDGVTEQDLLDNKSNLIIKLNQVVPENTDYDPYDEKVNGAKDIYGNLINPISGGGYKDGAGLAIDMSKYAMIGANPSFSSITTTCHATLNGTTEIKGKGDGHSKFIVEVANACIDATDTINEYGVNKSNFGTSCDGTKISNDTILKGKKIFIDSPSGSLTVDIQACNHISGRTNDFVIRECQDNGGKVEIDTTDIDISASTTDVKSCDRISAATDSYVVRECTDGSGNVGVDTTEIKVSASTTDIKSCDRISAITNYFQVKECAANGKAGISSTTINNSASTIDEKACTRISEVTNQFNITECTDGQGSVNVDTTSINTTACTHNYNNTNDFKVTECTDGQGTTTIKSCKKFNVKSNGIVLEQCSNSGETKINSCKGISAITDNFIVEQCNSGTTHIHSCNEITLESKNITLTDGDCGSGQTTIEVNDLCLVGERKINVYGDETNVGLDCDGSKIVTNTRVFGKGTLITTKATPATHAGENNVETVAAQDIKENADRDINETAGRNINDTATGNINETTANGNINESAKNINNTASNDICDTAANDATFYGASLTRLGIACNGTTKTTQLELGGEDVCIDATDRASMYGANKSDLGINCASNDRSALTRVSGDTVNEGGNIVNINAETSINETAPIINETATTSINEKAQTITESASTSISNTAPTLNYSGNATNISGNTLVNINANGNGGDVAVHAKDDITVYADDLLCESGKTVTIFAGEGGKLTIGGNSCGGNTGGSYPITYVRRPKTGTCGIHATTVDDALDEVYGRSRISLTSTAHTDTSSASNYSYTEYTLHQDTGTCDVAIPFTVKETIVAMSAETYPASSELLKKYTLWQYVGSERKEIGEINIPKDHILKDVSVVWGTLVGSTFTPCTQISENCHWYIKLVWNVFDPSTSHSDDKVTYLPADDFIKDINENNSNTDRGANVDVWYDGKQNWVSATTKVTIKNADGTRTKEFSRANGFHSLNSYTLNSVSGDVKTANAATNWTYDPFDKKVTITAATDASHINRKTVKWTYGDVKSASGASYDPGDGTVNTFGNTRTMSFVIPQSVDNINRGTLKVTHNGFTNTYDPASASTWTLPHSALTVTYGASSGKSGSVVFNTSADKNISIPTCVNHLNRHTIKFQSGSTSSFNNQTYDPGKDCANTAETINIPTAISHLNRGKFTVRHCNQEVTFDPSTNTSITMSHSALSYTHNGFTGTYDPCTGGTFTAPHSALTVTYGASSGKTGTVTYNTSASESIVIPTSLNHLNRGKLTLSHNSVSEVFDPSSDKNIALSHSALTVTYGASSGKSGTVTYNTSKSEAISIPTAISHLTRGKLTLSHNATNEEFDPSSNKNIALSHNALTVTYGAANDKSGTVNYDTSKSEAISIPTAISHLTRGKLTLNHNSVSEVFDPSSNKNIALSHNSLTINYGATCGSSEAVNKTYDTSAAKTIVIPKTISDITGGAIKLNNCSGDCITIGADICMTANTIAAKAFYSKSDENAKENIQPLVHLDYGKIDKVEFKSFNFKDDETKTKTYGVIAQQVNAAGLNELVHTDESGALNVDYISLLILKIASLESKVNELSREIKNLKNNE